MTEVSLRKNHPEPLAPSPAPPGTPSEPRPSSTLTADGGPDRVVRARAWAGASAQTWTAPFSKQAQRNARLALAAEPVLDPENPHVRRMGRIRSALARVGIDLRQLDPKQAPRLHVLDVGVQHGNAVVRTAAGQAGLARGAEISLDVDDPDPARLHRIVGPTPSAASADVVALARAMEGGTATEAQVAELMEAILAGWVNHLRCAVAEVRYDAPRDNRMTVLNLSLAWSPRQVARDQLLPLLQLTPPQSPLGKALAGAPGNSFTDKAVALAQRAWTQNPRRGTLAAARALLEAELARGQNQGILAVKAMGNQGDSPLSPPAVAGVADLVEVGAVNRNGPVWVADFSSVGRPDLSAPGVGLPVGRGGTPKDGTSFATPLVASVVWAMVAVNPNLEADDVEQLLKDPRLLHELPEPDRAGAGSLDPFAAILVAKYPQASEADLEAARNAAFDEPPNLKALQEVRQRLTSSRP